MRRFLGVILLLLVISGCSNNEISNGTSASFAYEKSIGFKGNVYVTQDEVVEKVEKKVGSIKHHSDKEGDSNKDNFSNYYEVGTSIFEISDIDISKAIAIEVSNGHYIKAINEKDI
ncbi:hypothetical protein ACWF7H_27695 [Peribacillus butanolivorans]|uniref:hypothetical protein n=1 Tax=Peribacillus butanolivorans TaxID=421767 RepID=UPI003695965E